MSIAKTATVAKKADKAENKELRQLLQEGLDSGISTRTPEEIRQGVIDRLKKDDGLQTK
jgi:hypothetical protein